MYIKQAVDYMFAPMGVYVISFGDDEHDEETEFFAKDFGELEELWRDFCDENLIDYECVGFVSLKCDAEDILKAYLGKTGASLESNGDSWTVVHQTDPEEWGFEDELAGEEVVYKRWEDMIYDMSVELGW